MEVFTLSEPRQRYNEEFKRQTVRYIQEQTKTITEIADELKIPVGTLYSWVGQFRQFENEPLAAAERIRELEHQLRQRERELENVKEELAIVKKAVHIFSKPRNQDSNSSRNIAPIIR